MKRKGNYKTTPAATIAKIKELEKSGLNKTQISNQLGLSISVICSYTKRVRKHMNDTYRAQVAELYNLGKTQVEIGEILGFSRDTIGRVTKLLPKRKKPHNQIFKPKVQKDPVVKVKPLKSIKPKQKPDSFGKEVNIRRLPNKERPPIYKSIKIGPRSWIETYSPQEYEEKALKYKIV